MLQFYSANVRGANTQRAVEDCLALAFPKGTPQDLLAVVVYTTLGHKLKKVSDILNEKLPGVQVLGASAGGVIGAQGPGESMNELAIFAISGPKEEIAIGAVHDITYENSYEKTLQLMGGLGKTPEETVAVAVVIPGLACAADDVVTGFDEVFTEKVHLFGGASSDNMKGLVSYQLYNGDMQEHTMWAIAICDETLGCISRATHGFAVIGETMEVTKSDGVLIQEIDGKNALEVYASRFKITEDQYANDLMPFGALAIELPSELWEEYGSHYLLTGIVGPNADGSMVYRMKFKPGDKLRVAMRDEELIFLEMRRVLDEMRADAKGEIVAVMQADCVARGRFSLNAIMKDELVGMMQEALSEDGKVCPWLGMYGFGEFAQLGGHNQYHTFTTSLLALYRKQPGA